jgi:hypothetical protein
LLKNYQKLEKIGLLSKQQNWMTTVGKWFLLAQKSIDNCGKNNFQHQMRKIKKISEKFFDAQQALKTDENHGKKCFLYSKIQDNPKEILKRV